jgi:c-di-GMP-binding flagellar brake protein YcgR
LLNEKLNTVIEQFPELRESKTSLASSEPQTCEVGADGMVFTTDKPYAAGTKLALRFLLEADNRYVETFCNVVRDAEVVGDVESAKPFAIAVEFQGMKPAQKEILIQHLFNRESETLRMRRLNMDAAS